MCNVVDQLISAFVVVDCKKKLVGIAPDGAASMVGHISGPITRLEHLCLPCVSRVWLVHVRWT